LKTKLTKIKLLTAMASVWILAWATSCQIDAQPEIEGPTQVAKSPGIGPSNLAARITEGAEEVFDITEVQPVPPGGMDGWMKYLGTNLNYPKEARRMGIEGVVIVAFVINADGSVRDAEIVRGIGAGADEEALRVVLESPNWTPAFQRERAVASRMRLPVRFALGDSKSTIFEIPDNNPSSVSEVTVVGIN
jgi:TonB family protein